jgi:uncharacterized protein YjbJ (UPF0337 family)
MDEHRIEGKGKQIKGSVKKAVGDLIDSPGLQAEGTVDRGVGKVQEGYGKVKDEIRAAAQKSREQREIDD